jgi:hypothetical protein
MLVLSVGQLDAALRAIQSTFLNGIQSIQNTIDALTRVSNNVPFAVLRTGLASCTDPGYIVHFTKLSKCLGCSKSRLKQQLHHHGYYQLSLQQSLEEIREQFPFLLDQSRMWVKIIDGPLSNRGMAPFETEDGPSALVAEVAEARDETYDPIFTS